MRIPRPHDENRDAVVEERSGEVGDAVRSSVAGSRERDEICRLLMGQANDRLLGARFAQGATTAPRRAGQGSMSPRRMA